MLQVADNMSQLQSHVAHARTCMGSYECHIEYIYDHREKSHYNKIQERGHWHQVRSIADRKSVV